MSGNDRQRLNVSPDGVRGLALMLPAVGLPIAFHVLNGAMLAGAGFFALSAVIMPFSDDLMKAVGKYALEEQPGATDHPPESDQRIPDACDDVPDPSGKAAITI